MSIEKKKVEHVFEQRPWGRYEVLHLEEESGFQVKRVEVNPNSRLSLQKHAKRDEIWTVVTGIGVATVDDEEITVSEGVQVRIPKGAKHRMANTSDKALVFIEVQLGNYLGEDDIERFQDDYNRA